MFSICLIGNTALPKINFQKQKHKTGQLLETPGRNQQWYCKI